MSDDNTLDNLAPFGIDTPKQPEAAQRGAGDYLIMTTASSIKTRRKRFLWDGLIPLGTCSLMSGKGGEGKSTMSLHVAAQVTRGGLDGDLHGQPRDVLIVSPEDEADTITVNRLKAAGADLDRVHFVSIGAEFDGADGTRHIRLPTDTRFIRQGIRQSGAALVILDPVTALVDGSNDKVQDVRAAVGPVDQIAQDLDVSIVLVSHFNKGAGSVSNKVTGSHAWRDVVRSLLVFAYDSENDVRVMSQDKSNYSTENESLEFALVSTPVPTDDGEIANVGRVQIIGTTSTSVEQIINRGVDSDDEADEVGDWLLDYLDREPFEFARKEIVKAARAEGFSEASLKRAKNRKRVEHDWSKSAQSTTVWKHPRLSQVKLPSTVPDPGELGEPGDLGASSSGSQDELGGSNSDLAHLAHPDHARGPAEPGGWVWQVNPQGGTQGGEGVKEQDSATIATYAPPSPVPSGSEPPTEDVCADCGNPLPPQHIFTGCPRCAAEGRTA